MYALDAKTGKIVWQFFLVPKTEGDAVRGPEGASPLDNSTWKNVPGAPISGGGALDFYDFGPRLWALVCARWQSRARLRQQRPPKDWHDWDVSNPPALITA